MKNLRRIMTRTFFIGVFSILIVSNTYAKTTAVSTQENVDVWSESDSSEDTIATLDKKDKVEVIGTEGDCYVVTLEDNIEGYVLKDLLHIASIDGKSTGDRVNIRQNPYVGSKVLGQVNRNDSLVLTGKSGGWYQIKYKDDEAWIHGDYVKVEDEDFFTETEVQTSSNQSADEMIQYAKRFIGTPYRYGGTDLSRGVDCSGFTQSVMSNYGVYLSRTSRSQANDGIAVTKKDLQPGDLVFFDTSGSNNGRISHVGMYIGNNQFIHAESSRGVSISNLNEGYYTRTYVKAARVM